MNAFLKKRGCPGWGANPGPLNFFYFPVFHHFTAEPQRLPKKNECLKILRNKYFRLLPLFLFFNIQTMRVKSIMHIHRYGYDVHCARAIFYKNLGLTFSSHAHLEAFLESAVLALVTVILELKLEFGKFM
jgi:ABC-type spermidine/putrescine transport system permease subunit I